LRESSILFPLLLREAPDGELQRPIDEQFHTMVFATRKEIRKSRGVRKTLPCLALPIDWDG
jgi:hypothetical protein